MMTLLALLAVYGFYFLLAESVLLARPRNWLRSKFAFINTMLSCSFCTSFWLGAPIYILNERSPNLSGLLIFMFGGASFTYGFDRLLLALESYIDGRT